MNDNSYDIRIGSGFGDVYFGFSQKKLIETLGPPDQKRRNEHKDALFYYYDLMAMFRFETSHGNRLGWMETDNPKSTINGKQIFRMKYEKLLDFIQNEFETELEVTDYDSFQCCFFESIWLELQFRFERLNTVCLGTLFKENDRVAWPKIPVS